MELEVKTKDQTDIDYNRFFYATMCHVCKRFGDDVPLKRCSRCKLISYCGPQHQKQHWAQHKHLCKAIQDVLKDGSMKFDITLDEWKLKIAMMQMVIEKKGCLELYEKQMFLFPKECAVCTVRSVSYDRNVESLVDCRNCALSFCKSHEDDNVHEDTCDSLKLCLRINLTDMAKENIGSIYLPHSSEMTSTFLTMKDFINSYGNIEGHLETSYDILEAGLSERLTYPLTLFYAMKVLDCVPKSKETVIHVVDTGNFKECTFEMWEILLHLIPETEVSLLFVIIMSGLSHESPSLSICDNCLSRGQKISFEFYDGLYEDYVRSSSFVKPDFAVAFNEDIQMDDTYVEIKKRSIKLLAKQNCPFLLTNYTQDELEESINKVNIILNSKVDLVFSGKNPFASLRPNRCSKGRELVFYLNNCIAVYRSLCS